MESYRETFACSACSSTLVIATLSGSRQVQSTRFAVRCPACRSEVQLEASHGFDPETLQILGFERKPNQAKDH